MKFDAPFWLWGLVLIPFLYLLVVMDEQKRKDQFSRFVNKKLWAFIVPEMDLHHRVRKARYWLGAFGFLLLALARPQFGTHEETVQVSGLDIMLALDVSNSMSVEDVVPSRLQEAKHLIRSLVTQLEGDRVGLVAFAGSSYVSCPLTTDLAYVLDRVQILSPKTIQNQGTDIGLGLETAFKAIERGAEDTDSAHPNLAPAHVVILISDGEDHEDQAIRAAAKFKGSAVKLYVFGIGTEKGGPIPIKDDNGTAQGYKKDRSGHSIVSSFHSDFLVKVAAAAGGKYWNVTPSEGEVQELLQDLGSMNRADYAERKFLVYEDRFQIPLAIAILLLLLELSVPARKMLAVLLLFLAPAARAESVLKNPAPLDAYLQNKKGMEAYQEGKIDDAQKSFGAAQARDPSRPELEFNQGAVQMQKGEVDQAIEAFKNSARSAMDKRDETLVGKSLYNLGNAFTKKGDIREAVQSYLGAIRSARETKNAALENEARKNLQLLVSEVKKQKQKQDEQKKDQEKKDQDKKEQDGKKEKESQDQNGKKRDDQKKEGQGDKEKENPRDSKDKQKPDEKPEVNKEASQNGDKKKKFESKKMTPEDADRVMSELTTKERELQERLQAQHAKSQNNAKDW